MTLGMADNPTAPRRRFQFRLRTLLIGVTLLTMPLGYIGWQARIVRQRRFELDQNQHIVGTGTVLPNGRDGLSWLRRALGDERVFEIDLETGTVAKEVERVQQIFPEAEIKSSTRRQFRSREYKLRIVD
jgi:hypothetical protein